MGLNWPREPAVLMIKLVHLATQCRWHGLTVLFEAQVEGKRVERAVLCARLFSVPDSRFHPKACEGVPPILDVLSAGR
jgi:hypothetical protein